MRTMKLASVYFTEAEVRAALTPLIRNDDIREHVEKATDFSLDWTDGREVDGVMIYELCLSADGELPDDASSTEP